MTRVLCLQTNTWLQVIGLILIMFSISARYLDGRDRVEFILTI